MVRSAAFAEYRNLARLHMNYMLASAVQPGQEHLPRVPRPDLVGVTPKPERVSLALGLAHPEPLSTPAPVNNSAEGSRTATPEACPDAQQQQQNLTTNAAAAAANAGSCTAIAQEAVKVNKDSVEGKTGRERNAQREFEGKKPRGRPQGARTDPERAKARKERKSHYSTKGPKCGAGKTDSPHEA